MIEILKLVVIWVLTWIQLILFAKIICFQEIRWQKKQIIYGALWITLLFFSAVTFYKLNKIIFLLASMFLFLTIFKGIKQHCFWLFWTVYWLVSKINYICALFLSIINKKYYNNCNDYFENIIYKIIGIFVIILFGINIKRWKNFIKYLPDSFYKISAFRGAFFFFCISFVMQFLEQNANKTTRDIIVIEIIVLELWFYIILFCFFLMSRKCNNYRKENKLKGFMLQALRNYYKQLLENEKETKKFRHDVKHHIIVMEYFLYEKKYQKLSEYLALIDKEFRKKFCIGKTTGNEILDAVLARYIQKNPQISFQIEGVLPFVNIADYDLCIIFSNAIINAIEACERLKRKTKIIEIYLKKIEHNMIFIINNPLEWEVDINKLGSMTTKENKKEHGYGIARIQEVVEKYHGNIDFQIQEQKFQIAVILIERVISDR